LLQQKNYIKETDIVAIYDLKDRGLTFFTTLMNNNPGDLRALTVNPYDINSLYQLPGMSYLIPPIKEVIGKVSNNTMFTYTHRKNDDSVLDVSNLTPWMTMRLRSPR